MSWTASSYTTVCVGKWPARALPSRLLASSPFHQRHASGLRVLRRGPRRGLLLRLTLSPGYAVSRVVPTCSGSQPWQSCKHRVPDASVGQTALTQPCLSNITLSCDPRRQWCRPAPRKGARCTQPDWGTQSWSCDGSAGRTPRALRDSPLPDSSGNGADRGMHQRSGSTRRPSHAALRCRGILHKQMVRGGSVGKEKCRLYAVDTAYCGFHVLRHAATHCRRLRES